ncbi:MAG: PC4/YdbC family ssDNA-binding protein [Clostridia bacterium]|nr:PC4/YdbC family ssDNA-binding protein [Clostridia bacterium]
MANNEIVFDVIKNIGVIGESPTGWSKEVNLISWNNGKPKIDIREWDKDHLHMSKGVTLFDEEVKIVVDLLGKYLQDDPS